MSKKNKTTRDPMIKAFMEQAKNTQQQKTTAKDVKLKDELKEKLRKKVEGILAGKADSK